MYTENSGWQIIVHSNLIDYLGFFYVLQLFYRVAIDINQKNLCKNILPNHFSYYCNITVNDEQQTLQSALWTNSQNIDWIWHHLQTWGPMEDIKSSNISLIGFFDWPHQ